MISKQKSNQNTLSHPRTAHTKMEMEKKSCVKVSFRHSCSSKILLGCRIITVHYLRPLRASKPTYSALMSEKAFKDYNVSQRWQNRVYYKSQPYGQIPLSIIKQTNDGITQTTEDGIQQKSRLQVKSNKSIAPHTNNKAIIISISTSNTLSMHVFFHELVQILTPSLA